MKRLSSFQSLLLPLGIFLSFGGLIVGGCVKPQTAVQPEEVKIRIVIAGGKNAKPEVILETLVPLFLPFSSKGCESVVFFPTVTLEGSHGAVWTLSSSEGGPQARYDSLNKKLYEGNLGRVRRFYAARPKVEELRRFEQQRLMIDLREELLSAIGQALDAPAAISRTSSGCAALLAPGAGSATQSGWTHGLSVYSSVESIANHIADSACRALSTGSGAADCTITYSLEAELPPPPVDPPPPPGGEDEIHPPLEVEADQEYRTLRERREDSLPEDRPRILEALRAAERSFPTDYRFTYEIVKLSVYGVAEHHEAFSTLAKAAEKAIKNGKAAELLRTLRQDQESDRSVRRLSHGHDDEWERVLAALGEQDSSRLIPLMAHSH